MGKFGIGQAVERVEDSRLLTGRGRYTDDIDLDNQAYAVVLRSPHAHADIRAPVARPARRRRRPAAPRPRVQRALEAQLPA